MATKYNVLDREGNLLRTYSDKKAAMRHYDSDHTKTSFSVVTDKGTLVYGEPVTPRPEPEPTPTPDEVAKSRRQKLMERDPLTVESPIEKRCRNKHCQHKGQLQPAGNFGRDMSIPDGLRQWCKDCYRAYAKQRRDAKKEAAA